MNSKGMFYTNVSDYETKEDMMNDFIALRMYDMAKDKEIERLKVENTDLREQVDYQDLWRKEYLRRIDKAIEYIESDPLVYIGDTDVHVTDIIQQEKYIIDLFFFRTLKDILQGREEQ